MNNNEKILCISIYEIVVEARVEKKNINNNRSTTLVKQSLTVTGNELSSIYTNNITNDIQFKILQFNIDVK